MSTSRTIDNLGDLLRALRDERTILRVKVLHLLDLFSVDGWERSLALSRFEKGIREASDEQLKEALRILRE